MRMHFLAQLGRLVINLAVFVYVQLYSDHLFTFMLLFRYMKVFLWILSGFVIVMNVVIVVNSLSDFSSTEEKYSVMFYIFMAVIAVLYIGNNVTYLYIYIAITTLHSILLNVNLPKLFVFRFFHQTAFTIYLCVSDAKSMFTEWSRGTWTPLIDPNAEYGDELLAQHNVEQQTDDPDFGVALS